MKLTVDEKTGYPVIIFRHLDKSDELHDRTLGAFVKLAKDKGIKLVNPNGGIGSGDSFEDYKIVIDG